MVSTMTSGAEISECGTYRYHLYRIWDSSLPVLIWVMLNPSTADASEDDPTIRRCIGFAQRLGYGAISVRNLFALRATDPAALLSHDDPVGPLNIDRLINARSVSLLSTVVVGFGAFAARPQLRKKAKAAMACVMTYCDPRCFGTTKDGWPRHPLYLPNTATMINWKMPPYKE